MFHKVGGVSFHRLDTSEPFAVVETMGNADFCCPELVAEDAILRTI